MAVLVAAAAAAPGARSAPAGARDVTAAVLDDRDVTLDGDTVVTVPAGTTTYAGVFRGEGTLTVRGSGTLVLTKDSDFTLPKSRQRQVVRTQGGNHPYSTVGNPDPPAVTVERGATLQYGSGGNAGLIGHFPYDTPGYRHNQLNVRVDGTLRLSLKSTYHLGTISGSGLITQPRFLWGMWDLAGTHPFSGVIDNGTQLHAGKPEYAVALPHARAVLNQGTWTVDTPLNQTVTLRQNFYQREYGSDINVQSRPGSKVVLTGQYSHSDQGGDTNPSLSDPAINWRKIPHDRNKRGTNIKGANVQWGDGTTNKIFMPGTADTVYINLLAARERSRLTFDYNGPVTLGAPIGGGVFHDTLSAPGAGDIVIKGTPGNDVTFAARQYYDGSTTVQKGAVLRLGSGKRGGDGSLMTGTPRRRIVNDGSLVVRNTTTPVKLSRISGGGSLTQSGAARTTLTGPDVTYSGPTTVSKGTLALADGGTLSRSKAIRLTSPKARLDVRKATGGTLRLATSLTGKGSVVGSVTSEGKVGGALTVTGNYTQREGGSLNVRGDGKPLKVGGRVRLSGKLNVTAATGNSAASGGSAASGAPATPGTITVLDHAGKSAVSGTFTGLREGAELKVADTKYQISYRGGDGNDVVLTEAGASPSPSPSPSAGRADAAAPESTDTTAAQGKSGGTGSWWPLALPLVLAALLLPVVLRRRFHGRGRRRAAGGGTRRR
ncbi:autotransporter-associated beta strand repeat-containing protein [Streptomyces sp. E11-3]|uniref:autotransporter-associated beta strand repeat-containing protein n=1 Tax=Streptomyces sp. E11-3 TaxID=3110112 RepID=UPI0039807B9C